MNLHHVLLSQCHPQPWRNGGGTTRELLTWPAAAAPEHWTLRVTVADIGRNGPFSPFPGVDRWFTVVQGGGVLLTLNGSDRALTLGDEPLAFAGEAAPGCRLLEAHPGGHSRDLNLMVRRGAGPSRMARAHAGSSVEGSTRWRGLFTLHEAQLELDGVTEPLAAGTLLWTDTQDAACWTVRHATLAWWLVLEA